MVSSVSWDCTLLGGEPTGEGLLPLWEKREGHGGEQTDEGQRLGEFLMQSVHADLAGIPESRAFAREIFQLGTEVY